uniref:Reelin domain-containing protein n=1 Tax=Amphiprion percula TaxID=161767 RepID=A0A3P8UFS7_AMPPE
MGSSIQILSFEMWTWILIGLDIITKVHGFSSGIFLQSCNSLSPQHPVGNGTNFSAQTSAAPFMVDFESRNPGDPITVVLRSTGSTRFRGFMMEAREAAPADSSPLVGTFISLDNTTTRLLTCNGLADSAVSQRNNQRKSLFRVNWTAPQINQDIVFRATFVENFAVFWENVTSTFNLSTTTPAPSTTTNTPAASNTTTTPAPSTTTNTPVSTQAPARTTGDCVSPPGFGAVCPPKNTSAPNTTDTPTPCPRSIRKQVGTALMCVDLILEGVKMEMPNIFPVVMAKGTRRLSEASKTALSIFCLGVEIASLILFGVESSCNEILVGLVCVVIVINFTEQVIWSLTVRRKLEQSGILAGKVCFVVHQSFTLAILYVSVSINCGKTWRDSWPLKVLIVLTVWIFLTAVWILGFSTQKIEEANEKGSLTFMFNSTENPLKKERGSPEVHWRWVTFHPEDKGSAQDLKTTRGLNSCQQNRSQQNHSQQKQKKNHSAVQVIVSVLFIIGTTSLAVAVIVGIFGSQKN